MLLVVGRDLVYFFYLVGIEFLSLDFVRYCFFRGV